MSTIFNVRNLKLPSVPRATAIVGAIVVALALVGGLVGYRVYQALNNTTVVAY
ncbi:MAG: phospholipid/cholesterol/gamma-HCH transport system substrate-binding protein, partial [Mycobacterium sp.]|nr:phospholipid/cholesterol/gamma-HCH transport system substrate-binding protein [Mycobacterium sp.]